jgi:hypothetical protein
MKKYFFFLLVAVSCLLNSCGYFVDDEELIGEWKYVNVKSLHADPREDISKEELRLLSPSITFSKSGDLKIIWDHKLLSDGKYKLEGNIIRYTENLPDGKVREFPFLIIKLNPNELKFQTMVQDATIVDAIKIK